ncbi:MAG: biotin--[acetyl-CoA-carboxylase] ligase [Desulfosudaceae bacterium]
MKTRLLEILRSRSGAVPAESLQTRLAVSAGELETVIHELDGQGYVIASGRAGLQLVSSPDIPFAWEFPGREDRVHYFPQVTSTMDTARQMAAGGCAHGTVIIAGIQTRGRGRMDRTWLSDEGGLYFTMVLRPDLPPSSAHLLNFLASLTLAGVVREETGAAAMVKWPNDILVQGKKICGMLSEMNAAADTLYSVHIGIGLNVNNTPAVDNQPAASLQMLTGRPHSRMRLLARFLDAFEAGAKEMRPAAVIERWKTMAAGLGGPVRVVTRGQEIRGTAEDVKPDGSLVVRLADGTAQEVVYGDCFPEY